MPTKTTVNRKLIDRVLTGFGVIATVALIGLGGLAWWAYSFTTTNVHNELAAQKIYFPEKGSAALDDPNIGPYLNQYAGQQLLTGPQAKAYADHFIAVHLEKVAAGRTYAEVSAQAQKDPTNQKLQQQVQTLFRGETLRGLLLGDAYAFWMVGQIAQVVAWLCFAAGGVMFILTLLGLWHLSILR